MTPASLAPGSSLALPFASVLSLERWSCHQWSAHVLTPSPSGLLPSVYSVN